MGYSTVYNINKYLRNNNISKINKKKICYCRVSSNKQKEDLKRQVEYIKKRYPNNIIIKDIKMKAFDFSSSMKLQSKIYQSIIYILIT